MRHNRLIGLFIALTGFIVRDMAGYAFIEKWSALESLYMMAITISSVGFMEFRPLSDSGRLFTMFLILCDSGVLIYCVFPITAFVVEGELAGVIRRRKKNKNSYGKGADCLSESIACVVQYCLARHAFPRDGAFLAGKGNYYKG